MKIKFDVARIMANKGLNLLTWEILETRGVDAGDLVSLWEFSLSLAEASYRALMRAAQSNEDVSLSEFLEECELIDLSHVLLAEFFIREAQEIVKFLVLRKFYVPDEHSGDASSAPSGDEEYWL